MYPESHMPPFLAEGAASDWVGFSSVKSLVSVVGGTREARVGVDVEQATGFSFALRQPRESLALISRAQQSVDPTLSHLSGLKGLHKER
jgi:hypothetical protein